MFGIGLPELLVIFGLALIVLGPEKLPEVARQLAKFINQLRQAADEFKKELDIDDIPGIRTDEFLKTDAFREHEAKVQALEKMAKTLYGQEKPTPGGLGPEWREAKGQGGPDVPPGEGNEGDEGLEGGNGDPPEGQVKIDSEGGKGLGGGRGDGPMDEVAPSREP